MVYNECMKSVDDFKKIFTEHLHSLSEETVLADIKKRVLDLKDWLKWLRDKNHITNATYVKYLAEVNEVESIKLANQEKKVSHNHPSDIQHQYVLYSIILFLTLISLLNTFFLFIRDEESFLHDGNKSSGRVLPFKGVIEEKSGVPLDSKRDIVFRLYAEPDTGTILYEGSCIGEQGLQPQFNGSFTILIGSDCGMKPIGDSVFSEPILYLGVTIGTDQELKPRYQIITDTFGAGKSSGSALQSKTIDGKNATIPFIDEQGNLRIDAESPTINSTDGNFTISGESLTFSSTDAINGNIKLKPGDQSNVIIENGRFAIGDFTPEYLLTVESSQPFSTISSIRNLSIQDDEKTSALRIGLGTELKGTRTSFIEFYAGATATDSGSKVGGVRLNNESVVYESSGADFAEYFNITYIDKDRDPRSLVPGMIATLGERGISLGIPGEKILGAMSDTAGFVGNVKGDDASKLIALVGQVEVWVSNLGGEIVKGDRIGASIIPGFGAKVSLSNSSLGYALEATEDKSLSSDACPQKYRKLKDSQGKRVRCGKINVFINLD